MCALFVCSTRVNISKWCIECFRKKETNLLHRIPCSLWRNFLWGERSCSFECYMDKYCHSMTSTEKLLSTNKQTSNGNESRREFAYLFFYSHTERETNRHWLCSTKMYVIHDNFKLFIESVNRPNSSQCAHYFTVCVRFFLFRLLLVLLYFTF